MPRGRFENSASNHYFLRRMAEESELAERASDQRSREVHERAVRIFRELIRGRAFDFDN